jgi:type IV pilus assembly protein PilY1
MSGPRANTVYVYVHDLATNVYQPTSDIGRVVPSEESLAADPDFAGNQYGVWRARSAKYNRVYYNPRVQYLPWRGLNPNNVEFNNVDPQSAPLDPMDLNRTIDLTQELNYVSTLVPTMAAGGFPTKNVTVFDYYIPRYYATPANGPDLSWDDPHVLVEIRDDGSTYQGGKGRGDCAVDDNDPFTCTYEQEIRNFANWFSYYRSREYAAKNALGRVVADATSVRIGYAALNDSNDRIPVEDMNATFRAGAKRALLDQIYSINSNGSTPLRSRLDQTGKYFECEGGNIFNLSGSSPGDPECPVPAAPLGQCQLNYALMFTDGRWNGGLPAQNQDFDDNSNFDGGVFAGVTNGTLADVAMHYYERDLHPDLADEVPTDARDLLWAAPDAFGTNPDIMHQHMKSFMIQLGLKGNLTEADIPADITQPLDWGDPFRDYNAKTDDVRHAALNGRGAFLTAYDPQELQATVQLVFDEFTTGEGSASAVSFNSQQIQEDSLIFRGFYNTKVNTGDLIAQELGSNGLPIEPEVWSAANELDAKAPTDRVIVTFDTEPASGTYWSGIPFRYTAMTSQQQTALSPEEVNYLRGDRSNERPAGLQFRERPDTGGLLGDIVNSTPVYVGPPSQLSMDHAKFPTDTGNLYSEFVDANLARREMVVVGANDGMLHVFDADTGEEMLGYVPDKIINGEPYANPLSQITSPTYAHKYFVDLTPAVNDVFAKARTDTVREWRTVVVGGLRGGGKGYFAIDLSNPSAFSSESGAADQVLWEFTDAQDVSPNPAKLDLQGMPVKDLGYSYSHPTLVMTNAEVGSSPVRQRWAAVFGNGYNSTAGIAKLFALFIEDGVDGWDYAAGDFVKVDTGYGAPGAGEPNEGRPNALGMPRLVDLDLNGTADVAYAGDLRGNLFRFDMRDSNPDNWSATRVFTATYPQDGTDMPQPITTQPIAIRNPQGEDGVIVIFGTGSFVTVPDATSTDIQSIYGIWDRLEAAPDIERDDLVEQEITNLVDPVLGNLRTISDYPVDYAPPSTLRGWYVDLDAPRALTDINGDPNPDQSGNPPPEPQFPGERAIRNLQLRGGFLFVNTVIPRDQSTCLVSPGGFQMAMNPITGGVGGLEEQIAYDLNNDGWFDDQDNLSTGEIVAGLRFEDAVPTDSSFIGNKRYTQLSSGEITVTVTNTDGGDYTGRLSWKEVPKP